jgi:hypothetical protein
MILSSHTPSAASLTTRSSILESVFECLFRRSISQLSIEFVADLQTVKGHNIWQTSGDPELHKAAVEYIDRGTSKAVS